MQYKIIIKKGFKFSIAGGSGVLTGLAIQYLLTTDLHLYYFDSAIVGYLFGFLVNFGLNIWPMKNITIDKP